MTGRLRDRLGEPFLRSIPPTPGVYLMLGDDDELLYVGKAKNLRSRIRSYTRLDRDDDPRRISMVAKVRSIRWEVAGDEASAVARETQLLRVLRPPFNYVHATGSKHLGIAALDEGHKIRLRMTGEKPLETEAFYGCFPFEAGTPDAFAALVRVLSTAGGARSSRLSSGAVRAAGTDVRLDQDLKPFLHRFLSGRSSRLLDHLEERIVAANPDELARRAAARDRATLHSFYRAGPRALRRLQLQYGTDAQGVSTDELTALMAAALCAHFGVKVGEERVRVKHLIVSLKASGLGFNAIASRLNRDAVPRVRGAGRWTAAEVAEVIAEDIDHAISAARSGAEVPAHRDHR